MIKYLKLPYFKSSHVILFSFSFLIHIIHVTAILSEMLITLSEALTWKVILLHSFLSPEKCLSSPLLLCNLGPKWLPKMAVFVKMS